MDVHRVGSVFRAVRLRRGWRQTDVARRAGVSTTTVSRLERGRIEQSTIATLERVAFALDVRLDLVPRWRGGDLDRMLNAGHAVLHEAVARILRRLGWLLAPEVTFSIYGERGALDILAFHPATAALLVVELKTQIIDVEGLVGAVDRYRRLAPRIARERNWDARSVSVWVALRDTRSNRRRLRAHVTTLRAAFPGDGRNVRRWLARPDGSLAALSFLSDSSTMTVSAASSGVQRVRRA